MMNERTAKVLSAVTVSTREVDLGMGWEKCLEVTCANGAVALIRKGEVDAVKVPTARGFTLHVCGLTHWTKWGSIKKGAGLVWADRKSWKETHCLMTLWTLCGANPALATVN